MLPFRPVQSRVWPAPPRPIFQGPVHWDAIDKLAWSLIHLDDGWFNTKGSGARMQGIALLQAAAVETAGVRDGQTFEI